MNFMLKAIAIMAVVFGLAGYILYKHYAEDESNQVSYKTAQLQKGDLLAAIGANGTVEPEELIDVGAQIAGQIVEFGKDVTGKSIDYGSEVKTGMLLARIDDFNYKVELLVATDKLEQAKASLKKAEADLEQAKAKLFLAETDWERAQKMKASDTLAQASFDSYKAAYNNARAGIAVSDAAVAQSKSEISETSNSINKAKRNLSYCVIKSPVDGVIIDRRVNIGQTVVSSLNAPSLFLIAKDLRRMQVWVSVNEADIGKIHPGQPSTFTVSAYPGETFKGEVRKIRLNATMTQNIVTYTVEVTTDNSSGRLLPFLTANVQFELDRINDVIMAPNAALRWMPKSLRQIAPAYREMFSEAGGDKGKQLKPKGSEKAAQAAEENPDRPGIVFKNGVLWIPEGEFIKPIRVKVGLTDGIMSEVTGAGLEPGMDIVVREQPKKVVEMVNSPFSVQGAMAGKRK